MGLSVYKGAKFMDLALYFFSFIEITYILHKMKDYFDAEIAGLQILIATMEKQIIISAAPIQRLRRRQQRAK